MHIKWSKIIWTMKEKIKNQKSKEQTDMLRSILMDEKSSEINEKECYDVK